MNGSAPRGRPFIPEQDERRWWQSPSRLVLAGFLAIAGFFLITEHTAHVLGILPWLLFLACPLMHLFMHGGHGKHGGHNASSPLPEDDASQPRGGAQ